MTSPANGDNDSFYLKVLLRGGLNASVHTALRTVRGAQQVIRERPPAGEAESIADVKPALRKTDLLCSLKAAAKATIS